MMSGPIRASESGFPSDLEIDETRPDTSTGDCGAEQTGGPDSNRWGRLPIPMQISSGADGVATSVATVAAPPTGSGAAVPHAASAGMDTTRGSYRRKRSCFAFPANRAPTDQYVIPNTIRHISS
jgi:hypothetical protein